jgi:hypothetical protein
MYISTPSLSCSEGEMKDYEMSGHFVSQQVRSRCDYDCDDGIQNKWTHFITHVDFENDKKIDSSWIYAY